MKPSNQVNSGAHEPINSENKTQLIEIHLDSIYSKKCKHRGESYCITELKHTTAEPQSTRREATTTSNGGKT